MKAKVFYLRLTKEEYAEINSDGWNCPTGVEYHEAVGGAIDKHIDRFELATELEADTNEDIYRIMNNIDYIWADHHKPATDMPRSMSVGDFIVWEDGTRERVASCGFETF